jgi:hypothetical protein
MACIFVEKVGKIEGLTFGVLDTPCYPARYYSVVIRFHNEEWHNTDNAVCNYFEDQGEAYLKTVQRFEQWKKTVEERNKNG